MLQVEKNIDYSSPPIETTSSTVPRAATVDSHPTDGVLPANDWGIRFKIIPGAVGQTATIWENKTDADNLVRVYTDSTNIYFDKTVAGTTTTVSVAYTHAKDTQVDIDIYQATTGMGIRYREVGGSFSAWSEDTTANGQADAVTAATQYIGGNSASGDQFAGEYPSTKIIKHSDPKAYLESIG